MKDFIEDALPPIVVIFVCIIALWGLIAVIVGFVNAQNQMNWCQYKDGNTVWSTSKVEETGKRWSPNALTAGFTGECIDPGDKGL